MCRAAELGVKLGITGEKVPGAVAVLVKRFGLPERIPCTEEDYRCAVGTDKKGAGDDISLVLLERIGKAVTKKLPKETVLNLLEGLA